MEVVGRSKFSNVDIKGLGKELLEKAFNFTLQSFENANDLGVDYRQYNADKDINEVVVDISWTKLSEKHLEDYSNRYINLYKALRPLKVILLNFEFSQSEFQEQLKKNINKELSTNQVDLVFLDVYWISDTLKSYPEIEEKWFNKQSKNTAPPFDIDTIIPSKVNIYAVGSTWGSEDQTERFLKENIWENGNEEEYVDSVKGVKNGDVLVLKSAFPKKASGIFRVKALGVVEKNFNDGWKLQVNWRIKANNTDIEGSLAKYRRTISKLSVSEFSIIVGRLKLLESELDKLFSLSVKNDAFITNSLQIANLDNDNPKNSKDLLGFDKDIRAFATLIALRKLNPPIAISLFGNWGSGKSFFMHQLSKKVELLSTNQSFQDSLEEESNPNNDEKTFCEGIAQITFNAWAYLDANLWAGLVTAIFQKLDEYINDYSQSSRFTEELRFEISEELSLYKEHKRELNAKKKKYEGEFTVLTDELFQKKKALRDTQDELKDKSLEVILTNVRETVKFPEVDIRLLEEWGVNKEDIENLSPLNLLEQLKTLKSFSKNLLKFSKKQFILLFVVLVLAMTVYVLPDHILETFHKKILEFIGFIFAPVSTFIYKLKNTLNKYSPIVKRVIKKNEELTRKIEEAKAKYEQEVLALKLSLSEKEKEIESIKKEIELIDVKIHEINFDIEHNLSHESLRKFITERSISHEYEKHLGIISIIRKDLETLSNLFLQNNVETQITDKAKQRHIEKEKKYAKINEKLFPKLERIILYIDDLDRCPDDKVLEVLQAVHLLMAFPLFVVVVGVDKRCVENALRYKNLLQYSNVTGLNSSTELKESFNIEVIEPKEYLEKIFQIPFKLREPSDSAIENLVDNLLTGQVQLEEEMFANGDLSIDFLNQEVPKQDFIDWQKNLDKSFEDSELKNEINIEQELGLTDNSSNTQVLPTNLKFSSKEFRYLKNIARIVSNNPRTIKRYINIYRIIRAHENLSYTVDNKNEDFLCVMFILALAVGDNQDYNALLESIQSNKENHKLLDILERLKLNKLIGGLSKEELIKHLMEFRTDSFKKYIPFVKRFSF